MYDLPYFIIANKKRPAKAANPAAAAVGPHGFEAIKRRALEAYKP